MTQSNTREEGFERLIERALVGSTIEERALEGIELNASFADAQAPTENQFYWGIPSDFDKRNAVDVRRLWSFLEATQSDILSQWRGRGDVRTNVMKESIRTIESCGSLEVLR